MTTPVLMLMLLCVGLCQSFRPALTRSGPPPPPFSARDCSCSGHGVCVSSSGTCVCDMQFGGSDCSVEMQPQDVKSCHATVGKGGGCMNIKPCLLAMPADCAVKTLLLASGIYSGSQNANVLIEGESSVEILGENGGAIIDGSGTDSLISVTGKGSLRLANLTLQHAFIPASDAADAADGPALSVVGQGSCQVFGVRFLNNNRSGQAGQYWPDM